jgi:hypothetical protein
MTLTEELIWQDLETLRHGGEQAISLFLEMCERLHEAGQEEALRNWITVAAPALPEAERSEVLTLLVSSHLRHDRIEAGLVSGPSALH